jgi:hypothetical protein
MKKSREKHRGNMKLGGQYTAFTDKVERSCHFQALGKNWCNAGNLMLLPYGAILESKRKNLLAVSGEPYSSSLNVRSESFLRHPQRTHCIIKITE